MKFPSRLAVVAAMSLVTLVASNCSIIDQLSARDQLNRGVGAYTNKQFDEAIEYFEESISKDPDLVRSYLYMAIAYRAQYVPQGTSPDNLVIAEKSIDNFTEVLDRADPATEEGKLDRATAMANLAGLYSGMGDTDQAKQWYNNRLKEEPDNPEPMYGIATLNWQIAYDETGMNGESVEFLEEERVAAIHLLVDEGVDNLKKALELNPEYVDAMQYLNLLYREKAKLELDEEAKRQWEREADQLALDALELKRKIEAEEEELRRQVGGAEE
ncbi:MAG: tetratricopeptide repeat protein [Acidobacteriota bacterium]